MLLAKNAISNDPICSPKMSDDHTEAEFQEF